MISEMEIVERIRCGIRSSATIYLLDILRQHAFRAGDKVVLHLGALFERAKTVHLDG